MSRNLCLAIAAYPFERSPEDNAWHSEPETFQPLHSQRHLRRHPARREPTACPVPIGRAAPDRTT